MKITVELPDEALTLLHRIDRKLSELRERLGIIEHEEEARMSVLQDDVDALKAALTDQFAKVDALLDAIVAAKDAPAQIEALVSAAKLETAKVDAVLNPPPPPTP